tara:strand:- start:4760 stop:5116 length:357 start_codon:yes stop_codon:yes gene_type:complete
MSSFVFSTLGGGMRGISTIKSSNTTDEFAFATEKRILRKSFPTAYKFHDKHVMTNKFAQTPFRIAMNAGDPELKVRGGEKSVVVPHSGKVSQKVYDSSDYIRFKRLQNRNRTYNDKKI